ncbi:MAG: 50S ribosomal protein L25 [Planctomycetota bacterium]|jgi:large subunit ribosomal protein L25
MSKEVPIIAANKREKLGSRYSRRLRTQGQLPTVIYGHKEEPAHVAIDAKQFLHHLHHGQHILSLDHEGADNETCLIKALQYDWTGTNIVHVDLARIDLTEEISLSVPLVIKGEDKSPGAKSAGAFVDHPIIDLDIKCLATNIPEAIVVDISELGINESLTVGQLKLPEGVTTDHDPEGLVVVIHAKREVPEEVELEEAAEGEPEVIGEKKEEEEE